MQNYTCEQLTPHIWRIVDAFGVAMYLAVGRDRACLIDTGYGLSGLRNVVESITKLPVIVLLTHGHVDHAFGIYEFDEIYMNALDQETYQIHSEPTYRERFMRSVTKEYDNMVFQIPHTIDFHDIKDGQVFDLGSMHIEALHVPGHTKGMMMFLFVEDRMMLFGDACGPNTMIMEDCSGQLADYRRSLQKIKQQEARYDCILRNHGSFESPKELLDTVMEVCEKVLTKTDDHELLPQIMQEMFPCKAPGCYKCYSAKAMVSGPHGPAPADGQEGNVNYREDKV